MTSQRRVHGLNASPLLVRSFFGIIWQAKCVSRAGQRILLNAGLASCTGTHNLHWPLFFSFHPFLQSVLPVFPSGNYLSDCYIRASRACFRLDRQEYTLTRVLDRRNIETPNASMDGDRGVYVSLILSVFFPCKAASDTDDEPGGAVGVSPCHIVALGKHRRVVAVHDLRLQDSHAPQ